MLVVLTLFATSGVLGGCAGVGGGGAPTETEPPTYYTGGLGSTGPNQNAPPAPTRGNTPPPTTAGQPAGAFAAVDVDNFSFLPATVNARVDQQVVWSNQDNAPHTVTANNLTWGRNIAPGASYARAFDRPGTFPYHCAIHPNMRGVLVVS